jgi:DNA-binding response OmpR family regulator
MILIVEDDIKLAHLLEKLLRYAGHEAVSVQTGMQALSLLLVRRPTLIIIDLDLPTMNGVTLLQSIRADKAFDSVPIVMHTADFSEKSQRECLAKGAQDFIVKGTIGWESILARIDAALTKHTTQQLRISH